MLDLRNVQGPMAVATDIRALSPVGCRCDVGGALGLGCDPQTGACRCRPNTQGPTCSQCVPYPVAGGGVGQGCEAVRRPDLPPLQARTGSLSA